jgi:hypothetical protein
MQKRVSSVFDAVGMVDNTLKVTDTFHVTHAVTLVYKATIVGSWSKPPTGKKLVALLSRVVIMFKVGGYNASIASLH